MTTLAILSDLHGNSAATAAVLAEIDAHAPDEVICLGDLVGYGARPNETIDLICQRGIPTIMGNYDNGVGFDRDDCGCAYKDAEEHNRGQRSLFWTRSVVTSDWKEWLQTLVPELRREVNGVRIRLVHGSPRRINEYLFADRDPTSLARSVAPPIAMCWFSATRTFPGHEQSKVSGSSTPVASANPGMPIRAPGGCC